MPQIIPNIAPALAHLFFEENQDFKPYYPEWVDNHIIFQELSTIKKRRFEVLKFGMQHFMWAEVKNNKVHLIFGDDNTFNFAYYFFTLKELDIKYRELMFPNEFISKFSDTELKMAKLATEIASKFCDKTPKSDSQNIYEQIKELHTCRENIK